VDGVILDTQGLAGSQFQFLLLTRRVLQIVVHQAALNRQIQELWDTAADMLSFLQAAKPVISSSQSWPMIRGGSVVGTANGCFGFH
jgi:hypothetical protein